MKLTTGMKMPEIIYNTAYESGISYLDKTKGQKSVILFDRYYGCTVCQLDLLELKENFEKFTEKNSSLKVVLQSDPASLKEKLDKDPLPYEIICDPQGELYKEFEIEPAGSMPKLVGGVKTLSKINRAKKRGLEHGEYEGEELQLPALFIVDETGTIIYAKYARNLGDLPSAEEIAAMV